MYFVDRKRIADILSFIEKQVQVFKEIDTLDREIEKNALERVIHTLIEAVLDVGNAMIDGFIMRDAGSYEDIIDILLDERVIEKEMEVQLKKIIALRKNLVQNYTRINHEELHQTVKENLNAIEKFPKYVCDYFEKEMVPVTAFTPEN